MSLIYTLHYSLTFLIGIICLLLLLYWLIIISYRLHLIRNKHKQYLNAYELDPRVHSRILYSFQTIRNREICFVVLILLEILIVTILSFAVPQLCNHIYHKKMTKMFSDNTFPNCAHNHPIIVYFYLHPVSALPSVVLSILTITQLMLISFLNSYLAGRYFGHSYPRIVIYKYILSWVFQTFLLTICMIPKLQIFFCPICTLLIFLNWLNLIISSRKMCRAIRSKMIEIRLFEWNPALFRNHSRNLKQYRIAMGFLISAFFFLTLALVCLAIVYFILVKNCFLNTVYGLNLNLNMTHAEVYEIPYYTRLFNNLAVFFFLSMYVILLFLPSLFIFLKHIANLLYDRCTGKGNVQRIHNTLFEPLLNQ